MEVGKKLLLVDGNSLLHRAYHAYPPLSLPSGELVNAVYGFSSLFLSALEKMKPTHVLVAWDLKGPTFRHEQYKEYKAGRPKMDQELADQIDRTKEVVEKMNVPQFGVSGFEADDIIATMVERARDDNFEKVIILTGDKDSLQLIKEAQVQVFLAGKEMIDEKALGLKFGLPPKLITDLKGLMGDSSDNLPGIKGIGQVTAVKLLKEAGSLENIFEKINDLNVSPKVKKLLLEGKDIAFECKKLATLEYNVPVSCEWDECLLSDYDFGGVEKLFNELRFFSLLKKLPKNKWDNDLEEVFK